MFLTLVVILTVRRSEQKSFQTFEDHAARVMKNHGGAIERVVVIPDIGNPEYFKEVHIVTFPDEKSYHSYKADPALKDLQYLRDRSVVETQILSGEDGSSY